MTRKLLSLFLALVLMLSIVSCGSSAPTVTDSDTVKEVLTDEDIEKVKEYAVSHILDFEGVNVEITNYKILHDIKTDLPNAVELTFVSDELWTLGSETHEVNGFATVSLYASPDGYSIQIMSMSSPSYYAGVDESYKLYYDGPMFTYYKKEGSDIFYHTISPTKNIVPGEYKDPTLSS